MDQGPYLIDTNVFVIDLRYPRDRHFGAERVTKPLQKLEPARLRRGGTS